MKLMWVKDLNVLRVAASVLLAVLAAVPASAADDGLKFIHNPGGGEIVYGPVSGQSTMPGAMGFILKQVHGHFSDKPQVGKFFRPKGAADSMATTFTLTPKTNGTGTIAGIVIVAMPAGQKPSAAVIYDQSARFKTTAAPMMKTLNEAWKKDAPHAGPDGGQGGGKSAPARQLRTTPFPDNSGSIGLPDGWQITSGRQGTMYAQGPGNEAFLIGAYIPVLDPTNPQQRSMIQMETQGGRIPLPGTYVAAPYGMPPFKLLQTLSAQLAAKSRKPAPSIEMVSTDDLGRNCFYFKTHVDSQDGKGVMFSGITMCIQQPFMPGTYAVTINQVTLPESQLSQEIATLQAMYASYKTNPAVIQAETQQAISNIHAIGERARIQHEASDAAWASHQEAYNKRQDAQDRTSQAFSNYILDNSVVRYTPDDSHATMDNGTAALIMKLDPNHFEYVQTGDYLKGIDY
jgi:hypothetical protein